MRRLITFLICAYAIAANAEVIERNGMLLPFPDGWSDAGSQFMGPNGSIVAVYEFRGAPGISDENATKRTQEREDWYPGFLRNYVWRNNPSLVRPLTKLMGERGPIYSSAETQSSEWYSLQYMVVGYPRRATVFIVRGKGNVEDALRVFDSVFGKVQWVDGTKNTP